MKKETKDLTSNEQNRLIGNAVSREITQEIMNYGVTQQQIKQIINLLALELEDNNLMRSIVGLCSEQKQEKLHV
tara:strand:+ start:588 stop:809 length:222 start_codon:yes stop_codon:yes gene_type:complete